jgi:hypothetical protein
MKAGGFLGGVDNTSAGDQSLNAKTAMSAWVCSGDWGHRGDGDGLPEAAVLVHSWFRSISLTSGDKDLAA